MVVSLHTDFGFYVSFDGKHQVVVKAPADPYKYQVGGLCDHYGKAGSMYVMPGGEETEDVNEFGHSWATEQCDIPTTTPCTPSDGNHKCDIIIDGQGPFKGCHVINEHESYYQSCLTDYCAIGDYCSAIEAYQRRCRDLGLPVEEWRDEDTCPVICAEGREYSSCGPPCTNTCVKLDASENCPITDCMEGCFCPDGTVLDGNECIEPADCGCTVDGRYFSVSILR
ncbi:alpha-tectorin-like [Ptychodera flava]|uniref:alpha-tectorin-like n=1 Tax=Ptychodera flava TaxID=63121 RepID=UPI00396A9692